MFLYAPVLLVKQQDAARRQPVASRTADFLVVGRNRARNVDMDDETDIRLVNAHAQCIRGRDRLVPPFHERLLQFPFAVRVKSGVVGHDIIALLAEIFGHDLRVLARGAVEDAAAFQPRQQVRQQRQLLGHAPHPMRR